MTQLRQMEWEAKLLARKLSAAVRREQWFNAMYYSTLLNMAIAKKINERDQERSKG